MTWLLLGWHVYFFVWPLLGNSCEFTERQQSNNLYLKAVALCVAFTLGTTLIATRVALHTLLSVSLTQMSQNFSKTCLFCLHHFQVHNTDVLSANDKTESVCPRYH